MTRITSSHNRILQELDLPAMQLYSELPANPYSKDNEQVRLLAAQLHAGFKDSAHTAIIPS